MKITPYLMTLISCSLVMLFGIQPHAGAVLFLAAIPMAIWALLCVTAFFGKRDQLKPRAVKFMLWVAMAAIVLTAHWYYYLDARKTADYYVRAIQQYKIEHKAYPLDLKAAGLDAPLARRIMLGYVLDHGKPSLFYAATFDPFDTYFYDFDHHAWVFHPD